MTPKKTMEAMKIGKIVFKPIAPGTVLRGGEKGKFAIIAGEKYHLIHQLPKWNKSGWSRASGRGRTLFNARGSAKQRIPDSTSQGEELTDEGIVSKIVKEECRLVSYETEENDKEEEGQNNGEYDSDAESAFSVYREDGSGSDESSSEESDVSNQDSTPRQGRTPGVSTPRFEELASLNENDHTRFGHFDPTQLATSLNIDKAPSFVMFTPTPHTTPYPPSYSHTQEAVRHAEDREWILSSQETKGEKGEEEEEREPELKKDLAMDPSKQEVILDYVRMILQQVTELQEQADRNEVLLKKVELQGRNN